MEFLSTTSLANELDIPVNEFFSKLKSLGWIDRKNDKWILTDLGKQKGGQKLCMPKRIDEILLADIINNIEFVISFTKDFTFTSY